MGELGGPVSREDTSSQNHNIRPRQWGTGHGRAHLQQAVQEGDVVGPLLQGGVEERQGALDAARILAGVLVLWRRILCSRAGGVVSTGPSPSPNRNHPKKEQDGEHTGAQLVPPLARDGRVAAITVGRGRAAAGLKRHG